jgi:acyl-coenzyme A thioesterase PaaI-like protein
MGEVPAGFEPSRRTSPFLDMIGPVYTSNGERGILLGLLARTGHLNARGFVHGAILAALLDVVCGRNCGAQTEHASLVTVSLTVDYLIAVLAGTAARACRTSITHWAAAGLPRGLRLRVGPVAAGPAASVHSHRRAVYVLDGQDLRRAEGQARVHHLGVKPLHALQFSDTATAPDLGDALVAQVIDSAFNPGRQRPGTMTPGREILRPVLAVPLGELGHSAIPPAGRTMTLPG